MHAWKCTVTERPEGALTLALAAVAADHAGQSCDEVLHPGIFTLGRTKLKPIHGLIMQHLALALGKLLGSRHLMSIRQHLTDSLWGVCHVAYQAAARP
jgi:hypothetical protein